jgi:hypothetical protein
MCSILDDMRKMRKTHNYAALESCIEELQYAGNRMEAAIADVRDVFEVKKKISDLKQEYKKEKLKLQKLKSKGKK